MPNWGKVEGALIGAKGIAFDGCHKIYVLLDDEQMAQMKAWGYDPLISADAMGPDAMLTTLREWYDGSCGLRFVSAVRTVDGDPNDGFVSLIAQGEDDESEDDAA